MTKLRTNGIKHLLTGVLIGYAITIIAFIGYSILLTYTNLSEESMGLVVTIVSVISVLIAGYDAARLQPKSGWLWGLGAGLLYGVLLVSVMNSLASVSIEVGRAISLMLLSLAGGGLGGVLGINLRKSK